MSDSEDSTVTYTAVSSPFEGLSDIGSPGVDGPPMLLEDPYAYVVAAFHAPPSPDYVPGPEEPQAPLPPNFVPEPVYQEFMPPEDEVFPAEEQPLLAAASPTAQSPGYVPESDLEEDPEEDDYDPEEDPANYPTDRDDDDDEEEPSGDDADDDEDEEEDEEEEHPAPADSVLLPPAYRVTARMSIRPQTPAPFLSEEDAERFLAIPTPPPSPLTPLSSPLPQIPSPPLPILLPLPTSPPPLLILAPQVPTSLTYPLGYRAAMIRLRAEAPSTSHSLPLPPPSYSPTLEEDRPDVTLPPLKRLGIALGLRYEVGESSSAPTARTTGGLRADCGFVATMDREIRRDPARNIYTRLDDEQTERQLLASRLNILYRDRRAQARTALLMEKEARMSREAWGRSMDASDLARSEVMSLRTTVLANRRRQAQFIEALKLLKGLQTQMTEFQRQQGPANGPAQLDAPEEAGSSP
ncbi:hypothetical protein Tco_0302680 [Tanacetum coccineum]